jgi:hypothetical protein
MGALFGTNTGNNNTNTVVASSNNQKTTSTGDINTKSPIGQKKM